MSADRQSWESWCATIRAGWEADRKRLERRHRLEQAAKAKGYRDEEGYLVYTFRGRTYRALG